MSNREGRKAGRRKSIFIAVITFVCLAYLLPLAILYLFQRDLIYLAHTNTVGSPADHGVPQLQIATVHTEDGLTLHDWFLPPRKKDGLIIVLFHGSGENIGDLAGFSDYFSQRDYGVFYCEYRGFGGSPGNPSEQGLYADGRAAIRWLKEQGYKPEQFVFLGASLGSGVAVQMALEAQPAFLALQSPYSSVLDVAKERYSLFPVGLLLKDHFDSIGKIAQVKSSLLILHGSADDTVPIAFARELFKAANQPKVFYTLHDAGHLGLYYYMAETMIKWLDKQTAAAKKP